MEGVMRSSYTLPPSPTHSSSSSSDFEFTIQKASSPLCPADELFYQGQLLPLHLSMARTILLTSSSSCSSSSSRNSTGCASSTDSTASFPLLRRHTDPDCCDSSRPSSVADNFDEPKRTLNSTSCHAQLNKKNNKYGFSLSRFSSVFKKEPKNRDQVATDRAASSVKRMSSTAREVIHKYLKKVKPFYDKLSHKQQEERNKAGMTKSERPIPETRLSDVSSATGRSSGFSVSFSGNLRHQRRKRCPASCPSSMRSSPNHSGVLSRSGFLGASTSRTRSEYRGGVTTSSMGELQSAIQGAIAHCKNSMLLNKIMVSNEI